MSLQIHEREHQCIMAALALRQMLMTLTRDYNLTDAEEFQMVSSVLGDYSRDHAKYWIRQERHGKTDSPGGLAQDGPLPLTDWECSACKTKVQARCIRDCPACSGTMGQIPPRRKRKKS
jgi:hypothetical protein